MCIVVSILNNFKVGNRTFSLCSFSSIFIIIKITCHRELGKGTFL